MTQIEPLEGFPEAFREGVGRFLRRRDLAMAETLAMAFLLTPEDHRKTLGVETYGPNDLDWGIVSRLEAL